MLEVKMPEIALALGGGGVKGMSHIGVYRVLEKEKIKITAIAGTSAGGLIGAFIAAGYSSAEIESVVSAFNSPSFFARNPNDPPSILGVQGGVKILEEHLGNLKFEDLSIPFACTAVDLNSSQEIILAHGSVVESLLATIAIPGILPPRLIGGYYLVDGAVLDPVPVSLARWLAPSYPVVAVCLTPSPDQWAHLPEIHVPASSPIPRPILEQFARLRIGQSIQIFIKSTDTTARMLAELRLEKEKPEVLLRPDVAKFGLLDDVDPAKVIQAGVEAAEIALPAIREALSWSSKISRYFRRPESPGKFLDYDRKAEN
jgi:NTE family protein